MRLENHSRAEQFFTSKFRHQPHLWLKLLVLNLTQYDSVMWLGTDTIPLTDLSTGFACASLGLGIPCITPSHNRNADTMLFLPDAKVLEDIVADLGKNPAWDGHTGYDQAYLQQRYPTMGTMSVEQNPNPELVLKAAEHDATARKSQGHDDTSRKSPLMPAYVIHYNSLYKPWFNAYCQTLPDGAILLTGPADASVARARTYCPATPVPNAQAYLWWMIVREALG